MADNPLAILRDLVEWKAKADDEIEGDHYLNGESDKYPGNGQRDLDAIVKRARKAVDAAMAHEFDDVVERR